MTKSKIFLFLMLAFILGVGSGSFFDISQEVVLIVAIVATSLAAIFYRRGSKILSFPVAFRAFLILAFSAGVLRFDISESTTKVLTNFNDTNINLELRGYINDEPQRLIDKQRLMVQVKEIRVPDYAVFTDEKIIITVNLYPEFEYGNLVLIERKLQSPKNFYPVRGREGPPRTNEFVRGPQRDFASNEVDDFNYINYLAKDGIFSLAYYPQITEITQKDFLSKPISKPGSLKISLFKNIFRVKKVFKESVERTVAEPNAALISGILLGSRENIPQDLKEAFNKTGTTHILAISGYNITIVGLYISFLFMFFIRRQIAFWFTVSGIVIFTILTGASASVIRAAIMGVLVLLAYREGRFNNMTNSIVFAGLVMTISNPKVLRFDVGFQLSFLATLGLIYLAPFLSEKLKRVPELWNFRENFITTLSAQIMVLPVILHNFSSFSLVSLPANVLILPVVPITMLFGFLAGVSGLIWLRLGEAIGLIAWLFSEYEILIVRIFNAV